MNDREMWRFEIGLPEGVSTEPFEAAMGVVRGDGRVLADPEPVIMVVGLGDNSVDLQARLWCAAADYWAVRFDVTRAVKEAYDAAGLSIPFPQRTVHLQHDAG